MKRRTYVFGPSKLHLEFGDITASSAQVLVSSDDYYLTMGGGVSAAIRRAGGDAIILDAAKKVPAKLGDVVVTTAGTLSAQHIFHAITIGPSPGELSPEDVIHKTTVRCLQMLDALNLRSIAFPAIGAGTAGFDYGDVAVTMAEAIAGHLKEHEEALDVTLYLFDRSGHMTPLDFVTFFEEFRIRVPSIAEHESDSAPEEEQPEEPATAPDVAEHSDDPRVRRHRLLQKIAALEEERNEKEQTVVKMAILGNEVEQARARKELTDVEDERLRYLAQLRSDRDSRIKLFFSYAHEDEVLRDELAKHLDILQRQKLIAAWHDRDIGAGAEWEGQIHAQLNSAEIILLLISPDFMASDYCYDAELTRALERHDAGEARVIPVIVRPVKWSGAPFSKLQALPKDGKPVTLWEDRDSAFLNVTEGLVAAIEEMNTGGKWMEA